MPKKKYTAQYPNNYRGYSRFGTGEDLDKNARGKEEYRRKSQSNNPDPSKKATSSATKSEGKDQKRKLFDDDEYDSEQDEAEEQEDVDKAFNEQPDDFGAEERAADSDEERGYYEDTRAKGYDRHGDYEEDEWDDRDQYEDFELITKKFIPVIHDITDDIMEHDLKNYRERFHLYRADWDKEKSKWKAERKRDPRTPAFLKDWRDRTYSMKAKFRCQKCMNKTLGRGSSDLARNGYLLDESVPVGGWTTGCCTAQILFKELKSSDKNRIELKFFVRAFSQFCKSCNKVGDVGTYKDEVERVASTFSQYLVKYFFKNYRPPRATTAQRPSEMATPHISELCSACKNGCCIYMKKQ